jgi:hypothetical protein
MNHKMFSYGFVYLGEGVDFHCSSVLRSTILSNTALVQECYNQLELMRPPASVDPIPKPSSRPSKSDIKEFMECRLTWLEGFLKSCMWKYSAGVNLRLPLVAMVEAHKDDPNENALKEFWCQMVQPHTKSFSVRYVSDRLSP